MNKILITNHSDLTEAQVLYRCAQVATKGRVSESIDGPCFCFVTTFSDGSTVYAERTKGGADTFRVTRRRG